MEGYIEYKLSISNKIFFIFLLVVSFVFTFVCLYVLIIEDKSNINDYKLFYLCFIIFEIIGIFITIFLFLLIKNYKIIIKNNLLYKYDPFKNKVIELKYYTGCEIIYLYYGLPNIIKILSHNEKYKNLYIICLMNNEENVLENIIKVINKEKYY